MERLAYSLPGMLDVQVHRNIPYAKRGGTSLTLDLYHPRGMAPQEVRPAVLFIHGDGPPERLANITDAAQYVGWGRLAAASGLVGVTFQHRSTQKRTQLPEVAQDVEDLIAFVRQNARELQIDGERLAVWMCSGAPPFGLCRLLREAPAYIKCLVVYYGLLDLRHLREEIDPSVSDELLEAYSPISYLADHAASLPPLLLARAGRDLPFITDALDRFVQQALDDNAGIEVLNHPLGEHAFDVRNHDHRSKEIIARTLDFMRFYLA